MQSLEKYLLWCLWWVGLGVLSSVGLGTGLHTFLLYLGPHIAAVTMAAYECGSTDFPSPPYPESILCPEVNPETKAATKAAITIWSIMSKVRVEAFCWGAGTALGIQYFSQLFVYYFRQLFVYICLIYIYQENCLHILWQEHTDYLVTILMMKRMNLKNYKRK